MAVMMYMTTDPTDLSKGASSVDSLGNLGTADSNFKDSISVVGINLSSSAPLTSGAAVAGSQPVHSPVSVTCYSGSQSPKFWEYYGLNKPINSFTLTCYRVNPQGGKAPQAHMKFTFSNVVLCGMQTGLQASPGTPVQSGNLGSGTIDVLQDTVSFVYGSLTVDHAVANTSGAVQWVQLS
jgi:type VI secretion system Hcp family effector